MKNRAEVIGNWLLQECVNDLKNSATGSSESTGLAVQNEMDPMDGRTTEPGQQSRGDGDVPVSALLTHEERVLKAVDMLLDSGVRPTPKALIDALKQQGVDAEWHGSSDGQGGRVVIFRPGARQNLEFHKTLREYLQMLDGGGSKERS